MNGVIDPEIILGAKIHILGEPFRENQDLFFPQITQLKIPQKMISNDMFKGSLR
jgi:hypothetical protein